MALVWMAATALLVMAGTIGFIAAAAPKSRSAAQLAAHGSLGVLYRLAFACASLLAPVFLTVLLLATQGRQTMHLRDWPDSQGTCPWLSHGQRCSSPASEYQPG